MVINQWSISQFIKSSSGVYNCDTHGGINHAGQTGIYQTAAGAASNSFAAFANELRVVAADAV